MAELTLPLELREVGDAVGRLASGSDSARDIRTLLGQGVAWAADRSCYWAAYASERRVKLADVGADIAAEVAALIILSGFDTWQVEDIERQLHGELAGLAEQAEQAAAARADRLSLFEIGWHPVGIDPSLSDLHVQPGRAADLPALASARPAAASRPPGLPPASPRPSRPGPTGPPPSPAPPQPASPRPAPPGSSLAAFGRRIR